MTMTVLLPLDGSALSRSIVPHVCQTLAAREYRAILLGVAPALTSITGAPPRPVSLGWSAPMYVSARDVEYAQHPIYESQLEHGQRAEIERGLLAEYHTLQLAGFDVEMQVRFGNPADEIVDAARRTRADLIAMATHGHGGLRRLLLGSVTEQVLARVSIPMLLLRPFPGTL
jgi:nucleotide-binding universal stress UspA family protein